MPGGKKEDYMIIESIGSGTFGQCQKIRRKSDGKILVWKEIEYRGMSEQEKQQLVREVNLLREFRHPHIVRYHDRIIDKANSKLYIVMEYCSGGDLATLISKMRKERRFLEEDFVWRVMYQLLLALNECHKTRESDGGKVLHRDLKPANVFIDCDGNVKLGDFGLARILHNTSLAKTFVGTPYYMSPEQFHCNSYDDKSDLWSMGCLLYELCALSPPFIARSQKHLMEKVCEGCFSRIPSHYSDKLHSTIASLLHLNPDRRPSLSSLLITVQEKHESIKKDKKKRINPISEEELKRREESIFEREEKLKLKEEELLKREDLVVRKELQIQARERELSSLERKLLVKKVAVPKYDPSSLVSDKENHVFK